MLHPSQRARTFDWVALSVLILLFRGRHGAGLHGYQAFEEGRHPGLPRRVGAGRAEVRHLGHVVLLGGDLYTGVHLHVAVPAAMSAMGSVAGFFAVPSTMILYPTSSSSWRGSGRSVTGTATSRRPTSSRAGYDRRALSLAVAVTGFVATMPCIALGQPVVVDVQVVLDVVGLGGGDNVLAKDLAAPADRVRAAGGVGTYTSGLRAPAVIAFVKDRADLPRHPSWRSSTCATTIDGGWDGVFGAAEGEDGRHQRGDREAEWRHHPVQRRVLGLRARSPSGRRWPCSCIPTRSPRRCPRRVRREVIRRNASILPAYSSCLGLLAPLGWVAIAPAPSRSVSTASRIPARDPQLFEDSFSSWLRGGVRGVAIGALVPAADHVHRGGEHVHAQHLQGVDQAAGTHAEEATRSPRSPPSWSRRSRSCSC